MWRIIKKSNLIKTIKDEDKSKAAGEKIKAPQDIRDETGALDKFEQSGYDTGFVFHEE